MRSLRAVVLLLAVAVAGAAFAAPASAHAQWLGSDPQEGTVLGELPAAVVLTYSEEVAPEFVDTAVVPPGGDPIPTEGAADGVDVVVDLAGSAEVAAVADRAGEWQLVARVVSSDGHPVENTTTFEVDAASEPTVRSSGESPVASGEPSAISSDPVAGVVDGLPGWAVPVVVLALLGAGVAAVVVHLRRRPPEV